MSVSYFITPYDPKAWEFLDDTAEMPTSDLYIDCDEFQKALSIQWKSESYAGGGDCSYDLCDGKDEVSFMVFLYAKNQVVSFKPYDPPMIDFVLWYRRYIPENYVLYFSNSSSSERLILTNQTTRQDIEQFMLEN